MSKVAPLDLVETQLLVTGLILARRNTILLERPPAANPDYELVEGMLSVMYITDSVGSLFTCMSWEDEKRCALGPIDNIHKLPPSGPADQVS